MRCPYCGKTKVKSYIASTDFIQNFYCKDCKRAFKYVSDKPVIIKGVERVRVLFNMEMM